MANRHFGKLSEVWKHGVLAEVLDADSPSRFAETHAGSADYDLTHSPERDYGVLRFIRASEDNEVLRTSAYRRVLDALSTPDVLPTRCPGSPLVAMSLLGDASEYLLFDTDQESVMTILAAARDLGLADHVRAHASDGVSGVVGEFLAAPEGYIHVDPFDPFSATVPGGFSPVEATKTLAAAGSAILYWYGVEGNPMWAWDAIATATPEASWWVGELSYAEPETDSGITGCGVLIGNASSDATNRCESFGRALADVYADAPLPLGNIGSLSFTTRRS